MKDNNNSNAEMIRWMNPIVEALKEIGRYATPGEVRKIIIKNENLHEDFINETRGKTNQNKFSNQVAWARQYLVWSGYLDDSIRGKWGLTEKGKYETITPEIASKIFKDCNKENAQKRQTKNVLDDDISEDFDSGSFDMAKLHMLINDYKKHFEIHWKDEQYKWIAVKHFQDNWNINTDNFGKMFKKATDKTINLLASGYSYPKAMIQEFAKADDEATRKMFINLYDETKDLSERIVSFIAASDDLKNKYDDGTWKNHYQTINAISTYLWLMYPDKYYIYKYGIVKELSKTIHYDYSFNKGSSEDNLSAAYGLYDQICEELKKVNEIRTLITSNLTNDCYLDPELKTLTVDFGYYVGRYRMKEEEEGFLPSLDDYDPKLTSNDYKSILMNDNIIKRSWLDVLVNMYQMGGQATCSQISVKFGDTPYHYSANATNIAKAVQKYTGCKTYDDPSLGGFWCILFLGKETKNCEGKFKWKLREPLKYAIKEMLDEGFVMINNTKNSIDSSYSLNTILYGPPGTGKTYSSILYAVGICENKPIEELKYEDYGEVFERFKTYRENGRISFTTFHQSYGYEEFIEGIRPVIDESDEDDSDIRYTIEDGIFKKFCNQAMLPSDVSDSVSKYGLNKNPNIWKVSLETTGANPTRTECLENGHIRIGWDQYGEVVTDDIDFSEYGGKTVLNSFMNKMQVGDVVLSCYSASTIDAIGVVTGDYEWHPEYDKYKRLRKVKWISKGINYNILDLNGGTSMTLSTVYKLKMSVSDVFKILDEVGVSDKTLSDSSSKNYVFIIDEINRGNISKIFGELITLIEETKRLGCSEAAEAILPYSHTSFGIPKNVYILGTMNTADRSIALMDTALRRRFSFEEMMPDSNVLRDMGINTITSDGQTIDVADMLDVINERIEYLYDREHTIGHAFFTVLADNPSIDKLAEIFENKVIPLLQEYFYEDYGKIQLVLGDNGKKEDEFKFILDKSIKTKDVFQGDTSELDLLEKKYVIQKSAFNKIQSYKMIADNL